jgi:phosphoglycolate phosphatase-like HAD superfamily hydrolase
VVVVVLSRVRLVGVNIDGVLLSDSFSPVIYRFVVGRGGVWSAGLERELLSQSQVRAAEVLGGPGGAGEVLGAYFAERERFLVECPVRVVEGARGLLERLRGLGVWVVCYGGLGREHFERYLSPLAGLFDGPGYVCTDGFRPGIREIAGLFGVGCGEALFIDDVARVGEAARELGAAFIGCPTDFVHSFQRELMREAGVRHVVSHLDEISEELLVRVDREAAQGRVWEQPGGTRESGGGGGRRLTATNA